MADKSIWTIIIEAILSLIQKKAAAPAPEVSRNIPQIPAAPAASGPDWSNPECMVSKYFSVKDCLWLRQWKRLGNESDGLNDDVKNNLVALCNKLDQIRELIGSPLSIHCIYRSGAYSVLVGGSATDVHTKGMAIDFHVEGKTIEEVKNILRPILEQFQIRIEKGTATWIHLDTRAVGPSGREFTA